MLIKNVSLRFHLPQNRNTIHRHYCYCQLLNTFLYMCAHCSHGYVNSRDTGYRGYSCLDDREADSDLSQFVEVLLLTLSNLAFLPAVGIALYKQCHCAAVIYAFTMFFSTVSSNIQWNIAVTIVRGIRLESLKTALWLTVFCVSMDIRNIGYMEEFDQVPTHS